MPALSLGRPCVGRGSRFYFPPLCIGFPSCRPHAPWRPSEIFGWARNWGAARRFGRSSQRPITSSHSSGQTLATTFTFSFSLENTVFDLNLNFNASFLPYRPSFWERASLVPNDMPHQGSKGCPVGREVLSFLLPEKTTCPL